MLGAVPHTAARGRQVSPARLAVWLGGPVAIAIAAWVYLAVMIGNMSAIPGMKAMMMKVAPGPLAGGILIIAGIYQFTPLKQSCLRQCQNPMSFLLTEWREGNRGALAMGLRHGTFCVGCCWALMAVLFVTGVMNPIWIIAITAYVLAEKILPASSIIPKLAGLGMIAVGLWIIF